MIPVSVIYEFLNTAREWKERPDEYGRTYSAEDKRYKATLHRARQEYIIDFEEKATEEVRTISGPSARSHYETIERRLHPI